MIAITGPLIVFVLVTGMWDPYRWSMYTSTLQQVAPVAFYGTMVDETGKPLGGVQINLRVVKPNRAFILGSDNRLTDETFSLVSDPNGKFQITDKSGLAIQIDKFSFPGYRFKPRNINGGWGTTFYYAGPGAHPSPHIPDSNNPIIFEMERATAVQPQRPRNRRR